MLADSIEAASRSLKNPSAAKLEDLIHQLIIKKLTSGQLSDSELTFNDIEVAEKTFCEFSNRRCIRAWNIRSRENNEHKRSILFDDWN